MNENLNPEVRYAADDIEDVEGHKRPIFGLEADEDVEGHKRPIFGAEADEDVEGHKRPLFGAEADETDDVSGHVQPRRDLDIER